MTKFLRNFARETNEETGVMMGLFDLLLLSVALAMDCFAVSIASGVLMGRLDVLSFRRLGVRGERGETRPITLILRLSILFGVFQALMPLVGWLCTTWLAESIEAYDHWVAFALLAFLGGRMIRDAFGDDDEARHFDVSSWWTDIVLAVATSIDALAVGISLAMMGYRTLAQLALPLVVIGLGSFLFGVVGHGLGMRFGERIRRRLKPELLGGIILIAIGVKILLTHLVD